MIFDEYTINSFLKRSNFRWIKRRFIFDKLLPSNYIGICNYCKINNEDVENVLLVSYQKIMNILWKITTF